MLYEQITLKTFNPYKQAATYNKSWLRSKWASQINQEIGFNQITSILTKYPNIHSVLDVGCGDGRIKDFLNTEQITDYTGIDITPEIVTIANKPDILHADIKTFKPNRTYDAVFAIGSFNMYIPFHEVLANLEAMHNLSNIITICNISYLTTNDPDERQILHDNNYIITQHPHSFSNGYADEYTIIKLH